MFLEIKSQTNDHVKKQLESLNLTWTNQSLSSVRRGLRATEFAYLGFEPVKKSLLVLIRIL
jgi:hypothetical protein